MTWTWDNTDLSTNLAKVRLTIGDTSSNDKLLTDEEIAYRLTSNNDNINRASIWCVLDIIAKLSRDIDRSNVGMSVSRSQKVQHYKDLIIELKGESGTYATVSLMGTSKSAKTSNYSNSDYDENKFRRDMDSNNTEYTASVDDDDD